MPQGTLDVACHCRLLQLVDEPHQLVYHVRESSGHESALVSWKPWARHDYERWCVARATEELESRRTSFREAPSTKAEAWLTVCDLLDQFKNNVERRRGWELLWKDETTHVDERRAQVAFWNMAAPLAQSRGVLIREPETGSGPVDFEFVNGLAARVHIEFKLASNPRFEHGMERQLTTYMKSQDIDSGFFVLIGFEQGDLGKFELLAERAARLREESPTKFIEIAFVDARRRKSASVANR